jgi:ribosome biogenesis GTPase
MDPLTGVVYRSTGSWYQVRLDGQSQLVDARVRGKLRLQEQALTNPIAVGDLVFVEESAENEYVITGFRDRENVLIRKSIKKTDHAQIIAANVTQALCIQSIRKPNPKEGFIDRFLVTCEAYGIKPLVLFTKMDLARKKEDMLFKEYQERYQQLGYTILSSRIDEQQSLFAVQKALKDQITVLTGHSGVGKSSLLNALDSSLDLRIGDVSQSTQKGMHTTTFATMFDLSFGGKVIDTPGIKEFGLFNISSEELGLYFRDFDAFRNQCKYDNCTHLHEPGCKIMQAVEDGVLDPFRYDSYIRMYESLEG